MIGSMIRRIIIGRLVRWMLTAVLLSGAGAAVTFGATSIDPRTVFDAVQAILTPARVSGRVVGVSDGDTITVLDAENRRYKVRLAGIDAPESGQAFGQRAKEQLSRMVFGQQVVVTIRKSDRYGRALGVVESAGNNINLAMVEAGFAWHYKAYASDQASTERQAFANAEADARAAARGLWREPNPTPPWDFRKEARQKSH